MILRSTFGQSTYLSSNWMHPQSSVGVRTENIFSVGNPLVVTPFELTPLIRPNRTTGLVLRPKSCRFGALLFYGRIASAFQIADPEMYFSAVSC